ncbi:hypothetical protein D3C86_1939250 [compost metagenome]
MSEAGTETMTMNAFRKLCRNSSITTATRITAITKSCVTASTDSSVNIELS